MSKFITAIALTDGSIIVDAEHTDNYITLAKVHELQNEHHLPDEEKTWFPVVFTAPKDLSHIDDVTKWRLSIKVKSEVLSRFRRELINNLRDYVERLIVRTDRDVLLGGPWIILSGKVGLVRGRIHMVGPDADLNDADLSNVSAADAIMMSAQLSCATLDGAYMHGAQLDGADCSYATLIGTNLTGASVRKASFAKANMCGASLIGAQHLDTADFTDTDVNGTHFDTHAPEGSCGVPFLHRFDGTNN